MDITKLKEHLPETVFNELPAIILTYKIDTPARLANFLGQCKHESGNFKHTVENLNYGKEGLLTVFPKYFNNENVKDYARYPEKIASRVYADRMGNGDEDSSDGWKYRGKGYIQITGKENTEAFLNTVSETDPMVIATDYPLLSAAWFWNSRKLNLKADNYNPEMDDSFVVRTITKVINGGDNGLQDRKINTFEYYKLLTTQ